MNTEITRGVFNIAVAGACMARGLAKGDAQKVMGILSNEELPSSVGMAYDQIDAAISRVRDDRQGEHR